MTGSVLGGEDVVQDALFQAYRKLGTFEDDRPLTPWLFRIAHNRCIDFLRRREVRQEAEATAMEPDSIMPADPPGPILDRAVERFNQRDWNGLRELIAADARLLVADRFAGPLADARTSAAMSG